MQGGIVDFRNRVAQEARFRQSFGVLQEGVEPENNGHRGAQLVANHVEELGFGLIRVARLLQGAVKLAHVGGSPDIAAEVAVVVEHRLTTCA